MKRKVFVAVALAAWLAGPVLAQSGGSDRALQIRLGGFFPEGGEFAPEMECRWNGPPSGDPYPAHTDVVMTPVVGNLTDDNGDGVVDTEDVPDIAFISYRLRPGPRPEGRASQPITRGSS